MTIQDLLILIPISYCLGCWIACILRFVDYWKEDKKKYACLWIPTIVLTTIFSPILLAVECMLKIGRWLLDEN